MEKKDERVEMRFFAVGRDAEDVPSLVESESRSSYVRTGDNNDYYDQIYNMYTKSPLLQSIINTITGYASSFDTDNEQENLDDTVERCIMDYALFGGFALFVVRKHGLTHVSWIDFKNLRTNKDCSRFWYSRSWGAMRVNFLEYPRYEKGRDDEYSVFYFNGNQRRGDNVYPTPNYSGCLTDIITDGNISLFWKSSLENNLAPSAFVNFNNGCPDSDTQKDIEDKINRKFGGAANAGRMMLVFNDNREQAVTVERIASDDFDQKYAALTTTLQNRIYAAFRINPIVLGVNVQTGFSKEEFINAYALFYATVIAPLQKTIKKQFAKVGVDLTFNKVTIYDDGDTSVETSEIVEG